MAKNPIDTAQEAFAAFQAGNIGGAAKLANQAMDQGMPFARSTTARLHRVIGAGVRGAAGEANHEQAEAAAKNAEAAAKRREAAADKREAAAKKAIAAAKKAEAAAKKAEAAAKKKG